MKKISIIIGLPRMWGSGSHMLRDQVSCIKKKLEKIKTERRERKKRISLPRFHQRADPASSEVWSSWNLKEKFETQVATIWTVEIIFWAWELILLPVNSNNIFCILSPIFFVFAKRDCIIQGYMCSWYICQPLDIILEKVDITHYCW